jgi:hypothetical protein
MPVQHIILSTKRKQNATIHIMQHMTSCTHCYSLLTGKNEPCEDLNGTVVAGMDKFQSRVLFVAAAIYLQGEERNGGKESQVRSGELGRE